MGRSLEAQGGRKFPEVERRAKWQRAGVAQRQQEDGASLGGESGHCLRAEGILGWVVLVLGQLGVCHGSKDGSGCREGTGRITIVGKVMAFSS